MAAYLILGCGRLGVACGKRLLAAGHQVTGQRRNRAPDPGFPLLVGDLADPPHIPTPDAILITAAPGLRQGRDNGLQAGLVQVRQRFPAVRLVYTGSTAVYADAGGAWVDEDAPLINGDRSVAGLLAIEAEVLASPGGLVLRCPAIIGPGRGEERVRSGRVQVTGDPDRVCSFVSESDLAGVCVLALGGQLGEGIVNIAHPQPGTLRSLHEAAARRLGIACVIAGDDRRVRSLRVATTRLQQRRPGLVWSPLSQP